MTPSPGYAAPSPAPKVPIVVRSREYENGHVVPPHAHQRAQLIFAATGVMEVTAANGMFLVPPQRAVWVPSKVCHQMRARGRVALRTVYVWTDFCPPHLPAESRS